MKYVRAKCSNRGHIGVMSSSETDCDTLLTVIHGKRVRDRDILGRLLSKHQLVDKLVSSDTVVFAQNVSQRQMSSTEVLDVATPFTLFKVKYGTNDRKWTILTDDQPEYAELIKLLTAGVYHNPTRGTDLH